MIDRTRRVIRASRSGVLLALCLCACLDDKGAETGDAGAEPSSFLANQTDFAKYPTWKQYEQDAVDDHGGIVGKTTEYLNQMPPAGATAFPIGTIIVKTQEAQDTGMTTIHAMAKRGDGFNAGGTLNWEFFELALNTGGVPIIVWRGADPPTGEQYQVLLSKNNLSNGGMTEMKCNDCHEHGTDGTFDDLAKLISGDADGG
ncbi:MAG TPA: hypothetical protein VGI70_17515 [Polyangiales bacterium]|jgi:hypothetical protein